MRKIYFTLTALLSICLLIAGCAKAREQDAEERTPATILIPQAVINGHTIYIPDGYVVAHAPKTLPHIPGDKEALFFSSKEGSDCLFIRYARTDRVIDNIEKAASALIRFNAADYYGAQPENTVAKDIWLINDEKTYFLQAMAIDGSGTSFFINSFVTKGTMDIYSVVFVYDELMQTACSEEFLTSVRKDIDSIIYDGREGMEFTLLTQTAFNMWTAPAVIHEGEQVWTIDSITEISEREMMGGNTYVINAGNGMFAFEVVEGSGQLTLEDSRFGKRELLIGYNSQNAPSVYEGVALMDGEKVTVDGNVVVRLMKKKWKEI